MNPVETVRQLWRRRQASVDALANEPEPPLPVADGLGDLQLDVVDKANPRWSHTMRNRRITFVRAPVVKRSSKIFTMGSFLSSPVVVGGVLYVGSTDGNLYALKE